MSIEEIEKLLQAAESEVRNLEGQLRAALIAACPFKPEQIVTDRKGEDAKVVRITVSYGQTAPVVVYRKKNGEWGEREYTLYSWDLPAQSSAA